MASRPKSNPSEAEILAARKIYEGTHGITIRQVASQTGINERVLSSARHEQDWRKASDCRDGAVLPGVDEAREHAEEIARAKQAALDAIQEPEPVNDMVRLVDDLPSESEEVLGRHKSDLKVIRALLVAALQKRRVDIAGCLSELEAGRKAAQIISLVHDGERRIYNLNKGTGQSFVVERDDE